MGGLLDSSVLAIWTTKCALSSKYSAFKVTNLRTYQTQLASEFKKKTQKNPQVLHEFLRSSPGCTSIFLRRGLPLLIPRDVHLECFKEGSPLSIREAGGNYVWQLCLSLFILNRSFGRDPCDLMRPTPAVNDLKTLQQNLGFMWGPKSFGIYPPQKSNTKTQPCPRGPTEIPCTQMVAPVLPVNTVVSQFSNQEVLPNSCQAEAGGTPGVARPRTSVRPTEGLPLPHRLLDGPRVPHAVRPRQRGHPVCRRPQLSHRRTGVHGLRGGGGAVRGGGAGCGGTPGDVADGPAGFLHLAAGRLPDGGNRLLGTTIPLLGG